MMLVLALTAPTLMAALPGARARFVNQAGAASEQPVIDGSGNSASATTLVFCHGHGYG